MTPSAKKMLQDFETLRKLAALLLVAGIYAEANAQYFGRNKVQYEDFDFRINHTEHFEVYFYPVEEEAATDGARMAERWYARLSNLLGHGFQQRKPIILYANHADFQQTNITGELIPEGTGGFTESLKNRVVLPLTGVYKDNDHVIGHELVHAFQYDLARARHSNLAATAQLPLWMIEGMAEYLSLGRVDVHTAMWLRDAAMRDDLPTISDLTGDPRYFPYRYGHAFWAFMAGRWGDETVGKIFVSAMQNGLDQTFRTVIGMDSDSLSKIWIQETRESYLPLVENRTKPKDAGQRLLAADIDAADINLAPALSPDGNYVAFFSEKDLFTIDLFLADARTGKVIRKLTSSRSNAHFDALRFLDSSGSWSPDGRQFALITIAKGDNEILIVNVANGNGDRRIRIPKAEGLTNLAWSPNGSQLAFSGLAGGISDLYLYDLDTSNLRQLTNDRHADIQPAWAPDGRTLAFASDRGAQTDFDQLTYSPMQICMLDLRNGGIRTIELFDHGKHINPQFSPDGRLLYFVSDHSGFSDVYAVTLPFGEIFPITHIATGISGITELSPAMSVAALEGSMVFSVFEESNYNVYRITPRPERGLTNGVTNGTTNGTYGNGVAAILPPARALEKSQVTDYLSDASTGLPTSRGFEESDYSASLSLDYIGQPAIGVVVDRFGTYLGGGISAYFSDMLGNRSLGVALQANGGLRDIGAQAFYLNQDNRWNWGVAGGHIAYRSGFTSIGRTVIDDGGQQIPADVVEQVIERVFVDRLSFVTHYPFSMSRRFEMSAGYVHYGFDAEVERTIYVGGVAIDQQREDLDAPGGLNLFQSSVAYVGDNSFFGFTGPLSGRRYRFEIEPALGSLSFQSVTADYRQYLFWRPFTFAYRLLHFGRYGQDAESDRLAPLYLGYETFVRGYSLGSFSSSECSTIEGESGECPEFDRLVGSRIGVVNYELRLPFFGSDRLGLINFPYLPTDLVGFFDAGVAWSRGDDPELKFERRSVGRVPVFSAGMSARVNVLGALITEFYYAHPFQRPAEGWTFGFHIAPGW